MPNPAPALPPYEADGLLVMRHGAPDDPVQFIPCASSGITRSRVIDGLLMKVDWERFYVLDTRDA